jgi:hypothetical protein
MNSLTGFLFAEPSLVEGIARIIDMGGTLQEYNSSLSPGQADALALASDWCVVGADLKQAMATYESEYSKMSQELIEEAQKALIMEQYHLDGE